MFPALRTSVIFYGKKHDAEEYDAEIPCFSEVEPYLLTANLNNWPVKYLVLVKLNPAKTLPFFNALRA